MSKKVIYVSWTRLTDKYARDWYINHLIQNGIEVEYWDVIALTREQHNEVGELDVDYLRVLQSYGEFENLVQLNENADAIYIMLISPSWRTRLPFQLLSKYNRKMVYISWGAMPVSAAPKLRRDLSKLIANPLKFFGLLFGMVGWLAYKKLKLIKPFDIVFTAGSVITTSDHFAKKVVPFNLCDYDHYIRVKESNKRLVNGKYAVFLDINLPYQSDLAVSGLQAVNPISYYQSLNRFFSLLEQQYGLKVVIAANPKSGADATVFGQRESYRLSTAELVKDAEFVVTHHSTALSYAILNKRPIIFVYTDEMAKLYQTNVVKHIIGQASYLDLPVYNIDKISGGSQITVKVPNNIRYDDFKYSFLTSKESESELSQDIFLNGINFISNKNK